MLSSLRGRQTQFYIDICYGLAFALGFGYLLVFGMDPRVAAFMGGLVLGYFLRVWENMSVYERILEDEVASKAETRVAAELDEQVPERVQERVTTEAQQQVADELDEQVPERVQERVMEEAEQQVADEVDSQVEERVMEEAEQQVADEVKTQIVADEVETQIVDGEDDQLVDELEAELLERMADVDEELAQVLRERLLEESALEEEPSSDT